MTIGTELLLGLTKVFWVALVAGALSAWPVYRWILQVKSRQIVSAHVAEHQKKMGTPTMGGLLTVIGTSAALLFALAQGLFPARDLVASLILFLGFSLIGFVDDFVVPRMMVGTRGLGWKQKLLMQIVLAAVAYVVSSPEGFNPVRIGISVFTVLFFSNAYNFSDGMDGLAGGLLVVLGAGLVGVGLIAKIDGISLAIPSILVGAILPFLFLNAPPAKVFMGDVGALPIGALLGFGVDRMLGTTGGSVLWLPLGIASFVMIAELVPVPIQVASVKIRKKRVFPMTPIHHAFEKAGWAETRVVWGFILVQALCSAAAIAVALTVGQRP